MTFNVFLAVVRGEIARKEYDVLVNLSKQVAESKFEEQLVAVVQIQSGKLLFCIY